jgi:hypothetical protein
MSRGLKLRIVLNNKQLVGAALTALAERHGLPPLAWYRMSLDEFMRLIEQRRAS